MRTRTLGRSGLVVSELCLGTMTFGAETDEPVAHAQLDAYVEAGGNLIDLADVYQHGVAEEIVGRWLATRGNRDDLVLATKARFPMGEQPNRAGLSRAWLQRAVEGSLRRLGVEHLDLYQTHCWDPITPVEETLGALDDLVHAGKIRYVGVSNVTGWQLQRMLLVARYERHARPVTLQPQYNLLSREIEWELVPVCLDEGVGLLPWSPLGGGWLTGKYARDAPPAGSTRLGEDPDRGVEAWDRRNSERTWAIIDTLRRVADEHGATPGQVALRWVSDRPGVVSTILGARTVAQLEGNLAAAELVLERDATAALDAVSDPGLPDYPYRFIEDFSAPRRAAARG